MLPERDPIEWSRRLVYLAAERTLGSWLRTALSLMALGFVIDRFDLILRHLAGTPVRSITYSHALAAWGGAILVGMGVVMAIVTGIHHLRFVRNFYRKQSTAVGHSLNVGALFALLLGLFGLILLGVLPVVIE
jgi:putative membrane protein